MIRIHSGEDFSETGEEKEQYDSKEKTTGEQKHFFTTYKLKPNENYDVKGYSYETDKYGRIKRCEGTLRLEEGERNNEHQIRAGGEYRLETDEGGHLIATRFGGSEKVDNIVPMDRHVNRSDYKEMENDWAARLEDGEKVQVMIRCRYEGASERPTDFVVKYTVTDSNGYERVESRRIHNRKDCE